jgi:DMSO reductase anchor subunit
LHLANPRNAWRSFTRFRTSWLSREAVFAFAFLAITVIYIVLVVLGVRGWVHDLVAVAVVALAWTVLVCTAMIYASLKPIRQWHMRWTPASYVVLGHWSGAVLLLGWSPVAEANALKLVAAGLGIAAAIVKWCYWQSIDSTAGSHTLEQAIGVDRGVRPPAMASGPSIMRARLLDAGHTHGTFLTDEFGFVVARRHRSMLRGVFWIAGVALPWLWVLFGLSGWVGASLAGAACMIGLIAERWLFFAEARHTVRLFHGEAMT